MMIEYILELAADLDRVIQTEHMSVAFQLAKPLADELDRFEAGEFNPDVRADFVRVRTDVRRMCTNIAAMHYKEIWAEDYPRIQRVVKGYLGKRGLNVPMPQPSPVRLAGKNPGQKDIFVSYAHENEAVVQALVRFLQAAGYSTWFDKDDLLGGQEWETVIPKAIAASRMVMLVFSSHSVQKRGFVQKELRLALDEASKIPPNQVYIMPVRLNLCERPDPVSRYHVVDLFTGNGLEMLLKSVSHALDKEPLTVSSEVAELVLTGVTLCQEGPTFVESKAELDLGDTARRLLDEIKKDTRSETKGLMMAMASPTRGLYVPYLWDNATHGAIQAGIGDLSKVSMAVDELVRAGFLSKYHEAGNGKWYVLVDR
jgi:hypothetical protein